MTNVPSPLAFLRACFFAWADQTGFDTNLDVFLCVKKISCHRHDQQRRCRVTCGCLRGDEPTCTPSLASEGVGYLKNPTSASPKLSRDDLVPGERLRGMIFT
ncbi:hypothetical protein EV363DRAFT_1338622 [Boletus edulis]|uniref:Secreted protein n=1 Tax=Boletus edulis BED1 TaxID=1328754 RepID=A0AAD4GCM3_BOLED|nr:hypothetical protein EV363DRAFT_1338622 [Boletus edulis]KAF8423479.1 hypothetical protein L210DRAFT_3570154 [Boletus edulis BED1]KAF8437610.1 hypothetical protein L210DRAFT_3546508 [Boletus edulis BED1]